uniref:Uncharacterized protein n=1 Tax=Rhizophora mucronata TaxID=61149 RepID=A0A2P2MYQ1_RHIMU
MCCYVKICANYMTYSFVYEIKSEVMKSLYNNIN